MFLLDEYMYSQSYISSNLIVELEIRGLEGHAGAMPDAASTIILRLSKLRITERPWFAETE